MRARSRASSDAIVAKQVTKRLGAPAPGELATEDVERCLFRGISLVWRTRREDVQRVFAVVMANQSAVQRALQPSPDLVRRALRCRAAQSAVDFRHGLGADVNGLSLALD